LSIVFLFFLLRIGSYRSARDILSDDLTIVNSFFKIFYKFLQIALKSILNRSYFSNNRLFLLYIFFPSLQISKLSYTD